LPPARATVPPSLRESSSRVSSLLACYALGPLAPRGQYSCHHEACSARSAWPRPGRACLSAWIEHCACFSLIAPSRCRDQLPKRSVMQSPGITLSFHREMANSSRELVGPDVSAAVTFESYPRFIKGGFQDYEGLGIKRSTANSKHVPSVRSRLRGTKVFWSFPQKVVECLELRGASVRRENFPPR
jgi:hypothetical protein